jgi:hypothetical protein
MKRENFITEEENAASVKYIFIIIAYVFASIFLTIILISAYYASDRNQYMLIAAISILVLIYASSILTITLLNKTIYDNITYMGLLGSSIFIMFFMFFIGIYFLFKHFTTRPKPMIVNEYGEL